jgi:hypothetical protein
MGLSKTVAEAGDIISCQQETSYDVAVRDTSMLACVREGRWGHWCVLLAVHAVCADDMLRWELPDTCTTRLVCCHATGAGCDLLSTAGCHVRRVQTLPEGVGVAGASPPTLRVGWATVLLRCCLCGQRHCQVVRLGGLRHQDGCLYKYACTGGLRAGS